MALPTLKAIGHQGSWFAKVGDQEVPCVWAFWLTAMHYQDIGADPSDTKWQKFLEALRSSKLVALTGRRVQDGKWLREGYIGLFKIENVTLTESGLEFDLVERTAHLK